MSEENVNPVVTESVEASQETAHVEHVEHVEPVQAAEAHATQASHEEAPAGMLASLMALKESNANAFYGILGGVGVLLLALVMFGFGGGDEVLKKADTKSLAAAAIEKGVWTLILGRCSCFARRSATSAQARFC